MRLKERIPIVLEQFRKPEVRMAFYEDCNQSNLRSKILFCGSEFLTYFEEEEIEKFWLNHPDLRLTQVLLYFNIFENKIGFWFHKEETEWLIEKGFIEPRDIYFWGVNYDKNMNKLPETKYTLIKDLETDHIENILNNGYVEGLPSLKKLFKEELEYRKSSEPKTTTDYKFKIGDKVEKINGYAFVGEVVSVFTNSQGDVRLVVEHERSQRENSAGMLHIFNEKQLEKV